MNTIDAIMAIEAVIGVAILFVVFVLAASLQWANLDMGVVGKIQLSACVAAFISCAGAIINGFNFYSSDNFVQSWCWLEAWCTCFGELALVLSQVGTAFFFYYSLVLSVGQSRGERYVLIAFQCLVWIPAATLTIVPARLDLLGLRRDSDGVEFCWFRDGYLRWELGSFYIPLFVSNFISLVTFFVAIYKIHTISRAAKSNISTQEKSAQEVALFRRLALQLGILFIIFVPDAINYCVSNFSELSVPMWVSWITLSCWRSEGYMTALLWLSNMRVRKELKRVWYVRAIRTRLGWDQNESLEMSVRGLVRV